MATAPTAPTRTLARTLLALLLASGAATPLAAQQRDADSGPREPVTMTGVVVDAGSEMRIPGAAVFIGTIRRVFTDRDGRFAITDLRPGLYAVTVAQIGYDSLRVELEVSEGDAPVTLRISPDPVVLERVVAIADRFRSRRNAVATSVRAFDQAGLRTSASQTVMDFVQTRTGMHRVACPSRVAMSPCAYVRGRPTQVMVYVDGSRILAGLDILNSLRPEEVYLLEVYGGGRAVQVFTNWYIERAAQGRTNPVPIFF